MMYIFFLPILNQTECDGMLNLEQKYVHVRTNNCLIPFEISEFVLFYFNGSFVFFNGSFNGKEHLAGCS